MSNTKQSHLFYGVPLIPFDRTPESLGTSASGPFSCFLRHDRMIAIAVVTPPGGFGVEMTFRQLPTVKPTGGGEITNAEAWDCAKQELSRWADAYERGGKYAWVLA